MGRQRESKAVPGVGVCRALLHLLATCRGPIQLMTMDVNLHKGFLQSAKGSVLEPV